MTTLHPTVEQAQALIDFERYDQALALLGRHLAEDPGDIRAWVKIGYCHLNTEGPRQARRRPRKPSSWIPRTTAH